MARRVVIVGNGIAGITAARHVRKIGDDAVAVVSSESARFFSRTALMYVFMGHLSPADLEPYDDGFWARNRIDLVHDHAVRVDTAGRRVFLRGGGGLDYDALLLATGSRSRRLECPGIDAAGVQSFYGLEDLRALERHALGARAAVIVGGGLIGVEAAEMLRSRGLDVTFLAREARWMDFAFPAEESGMIEDEIRRHGVDLRLATELRRVVPGQDGRVREVITSSGERIRCDLLMTTVGVAPRTTLAREAGIACDRGILVDPLLRTSAPDVWAAGDCAQLRSPASSRRAVEAVWYVGRRMGETAARTICGQPTVYDQGLWFNSAKFFDLEWQTYGDVPPRAPRGTESLFWRHPVLARSIRINCEGADGPVTGFGLLGIRYRHEVCEAWIRQARPLRHVLERLGAANFDPELSARHEADVVAAFNATRPAPPVRLRRGRGPRAWLDALGAP